MLEKDLVQTVANDLGITQFKTESDAQFNNRVIYSALACWIKAACQDNSVAGNLSEGVSRRHVYERCSRVLSGFLCRYPSCVPWFSTEDNNNDAIAVLRSRLIRHCEVINVGFSTNITLVKPSCDVITNELELVRGVLFAPNAKYCGIALVRKPQSSELAGSSEVEPVSQWFDAYVKTAWWEPFDMSKHENLEYFDARKYTSNMYKCWQSTIPKTVDRYLVVRRPANVNSHEYLLVDTLKNKMHRIDPVLKEFGEHRRFMFALRAKVNNSVPASFTKHTDHVHLKMRTYLPARETQLLETFAWPHSSIADRLEWDLSIPLWNYISPFLSALGMAIREEKHG